MKRIIITVLIVLGVVALSARARTAFAVEIEIYEKQQCFPAPAIHARFRLEGWARVSAGIITHGKVRVEVWASRQDGRFMIVNIFAETRQLCIAAAGVNWQNYMVSP